MAREPPQEATFAGLQLDPEEMMEGILVGDAEWTRLTQYVSDTDYERVMEQSIFLWVYGIVLYQDVFGRHETRFCYRYIVSDPQHNWYQVFAPCGRPEYNRTT